MIANGEVTWKEHIFEGADIPCYLIKNIWTGQQGPAEDLTYRLLTRNSLPKQQRQKSDEKSVDVSPTLKNKENIFETYWGSKQVQKEQVL